MFSVTKDDAEDGRTQEQAKDAMRKQTTTVLVGFAVVAVAVVSPLVLGNGYLPWSPAPKETVSGLVSCRTGRSVVNVWLAEDTGVGLYVTKGTDEESRSTTAYRATIPKGVTYQLHVGCGGSPQNWAMSASSINTTAVSLTVKCDDVRGDPAYGTCSLANSPAAVNSP
jgi:hypothetical protein